jgi:hypothetical protein
MSPKRLENLLNPNKDGGLGGLVRRAREMGELATALSSGLPPELAAGVVAANLRDDGELVVICPSPAWASRLRFESERVLAAARDAGVDATTLTARVSQQL